MIDPVIAVLSPLPWSEVAARLILAIALAGLRQKNNKKTASNPVMAINLHQTPKNR